MTLKRDKVKITLEWIIVSYRAIAFCTVSAVGLLAFVLYLIAPNYCGRKIKSALVAISGGVVSTGEAGTRPKHEAHFANLDGTVRVKKARSLQWSGADYNMGLEKGDFVQTGSDGIARIIFADGTNYVLKPNSLIVVEESREDPVTRAMKVAVHVSSGAVDLATGKFEVAGSTSQVAFADVVANLAEESRAVVRNDPAANRHEFTVDQGEADVRRGATSLRLGQYEQVTFNPDTPGLVRQKVIAPPTLLEPVNMGLTLSEDPKHTPVGFAWSEIPEAVAYHLQISPSAMFTKFVVDKKVRGTTAAKVAGLAEGTYYWVVSSIDAKGTESQPSPANRFSLVQQVEAGHKVFLEITQIALHGRVAEVVGKTEPGSAVSINNEQVFSIAPDGTFRHFTSPLPRPGSNEIVITAQNPKGETNTVRQTIEIEE